MINIGAINSRHTKIMVLQKIMDCNENNPRYDVHTLPKKL
jgi:hypothetical protein